MTFLKNQRFHFKTQRNIAATWAAMAWKLGHLVFVGDDHDLHQGLQRGFQGAGVKEAQEDLAQFDAILKACWSGWIRLCLSLFVV